jgi:monothiol glutaredoxin
MTNKVSEFIQNEIDNNDVVLFIKGTASFPQCGFSSMVANIMRKVGAQFKDINVLADENLRAGVKDFTQWPTIPQVYIKGEFTGGCDILREMFESGELVQLLKEKNIL